MPVGALPTNKSAAVCWRAFQANISKGLVGEGLGVALSCSVFKYFLICILMYSCIHIYFDIIFKIYLAKRQS